MNDEATRQLLHAIDPSAGAAVEIAGDGSLGSVFAVTELATASIAAAGLAAARVAQLLDGSVHPVTVDRRLASVWFAWTLQPDGWTIPGPWDALAGDYAATDGWVKLHTNAPHHRAAALAALGCAADREAVAAAVSRWRADDLEAAVVAAGGCAAAMREVAAWDAHAQGAAVRAEPLVHREHHDDALPLPERARRATAARPLTGVRVLDLTRVLAGPVATRFLAALGADVLRVDPPTWDEPGVVPEVTLGKRCARLDASGEEGRAVLRELLAGADVLVHGYRPGALDHLGLDVAARAEVAPGLVDVSLCAYGWGGPWHGRRGFDSLVQMSCGIAAAGMHAARTDRPVPLPVQALDHATGYLLAAAALDGWAQRLASGHGTTARASLARTARLLVDAPPGDPGASLAPLGDDDLVAEATSWGAARRVRPPVGIGGVELAWQHGARSLGADPPAWW